MSFLGHLTFLRGTELRIPYLKVNLNSQTVHVVNISFSQMFQRLITLVNANTHMKFWFWEFFWMVVNLRITSSLTNLPDWLNLKGPEWSCYNVNQVMLLFWSWLLPSHLRLKAHVLTVQAAPWPSPAPRNFSDLPSYYSATYSVLQPH